MSKSDFISRRNNSEGLRLSEGKALAERMLQVTKDENEYYNNKRIFTKEDQGAYKKQIPDYFRVLDNPGKKPHLTWHSE